MRECLGTCDRGHDRAGEDQSLAGTMPGTAFMGLCSTVPVMRSHALGIPLVVILERPGVAKQDTLPPVEDR